MKRLQLKLPDDYFARLEAQAAEIGMSAGNFLLHLAANELSRSKHESSAKSPGRPAQAPEVKRLRELAAEIRGIYKRMQIGPWAAEPRRFEEIFAPQIAEVDKLVETNDLAGLEQFYLRSPWRLT